ncbi:2082_t:CDS:2, partial [Scutellospora calospora]
PQAVKFLATSAGIRLDQSKYRVKYSQDLIHGPLLQDNNLENAENNDDSSSMSNDDDILTARNKHYLKYAYQQFKQQ